MHNFIPRDLEEGLKVGLNRKQIYTFMTTQLHTGLVHLAFGQMPDGPPTNANSTIACLEYDANECFGHRKMYFLNELFYTILLRKCLLFRILIKFTIYPK